MARTRSPNRSKSFEIYKESNGKLTPLEISNILEEKVNNIRSWKRLDNWDKQLGVNKSPGAPKNNKNAIGNKGGSAPKENFNAVKHGMYIPVERLTKGNLSKILPKTMVNTIQELCMESPIDKLWRSILVQESRILNMQMITHVKDKNDTTKEIKKVVSGDMSIEEYEIQTAVEKENNSVSALSKAMKVLADMIKQYEEMIHKDWDLVTEEQKLRIEKLKKEVHGDKKDTSKLDALINVITQSDD